MRRLILSAVLGMLTLAGCGGSAKTNGTSVSASTTSTHSTAPSPISSGRAGATTSHGAGHARRSIPRATGADSSTAAAPVSATSSTAQTPTSAGRFPTAREVGAARAAYRLCQRERPGITMAELEREAATPEGIQC